MPATKLKDFLDQHRVKYVSVRHSTAYTSQEIAASAHVKGRNMAKTVVVKLSGKLALAVLPAKYNVDLPRLAEVAGAGFAELASEQEFETHFPGCETGAMPPFGNLYGLPVYVEEALARDEQIDFNAGSHTELLQLAYADFERLVKPKVASFGVLRH
jgi:Ala-tRNA(Pro) deacylase